MISDCCKQLVDALRSTCGSPQCTNRMTCSDTVLHEYVNGQVVMVIHDGGSSGIKIGFCPFCGTRLKRRTSKKSR